MSRWDRQAKFTLKGRRLSVVKFKWYMHRFFKIVVTYLFISVHSSVSSVKRKLQSSLNIHCLHSNWLFWKTQPKQKILLEKTNFEGRVGTTWPSYNVLQIPFSRNFLCKLMIFFFYHHLYKSITKSYKGRCKKKPLKFKILHAVLLLRRNEKVILISNNSWRLTLPVVTGKNWHALDSGHGFGEVTSDRTDPCPTDSSCDAEHTQSRCPSPIPFGDWLGFFSSFTLGSSTWIRSKPIAN